LAGVSLVALLFGNLFTQPPVNYVVTVPGWLGWMGAVLGELVIAFIMMMMVLLTSNHKKLNRYTGIFAGCLVMLYVTLKPRCLVWHEPCPQFCLSASSTKLDGILAVCACATTRHVFSRRTVPILVWTQSC